MCFRIHMLKIIHIGQTKKLQLTVESSCCCFLKMRLPVVIFAHCIKISSNIFIRKIIFVHIFYFKLQKVTKFDNTAIITNLSPAYLTRHLQDLIKIETTNTWKSSFFLWTYLRNLQVQIRLLRCMICSILGCSSW